MSIGFAKAIVLVSAAAIGVIRGRHSWRPRATIISRRGGVREHVALAAVVAGFAVPVLWASTKLLAFADGVPDARAAAAGVLVQACALWLFYRTHADLGGNFSARVQILDSHQLVTSGVYSRIRHPMYLALMLFGLGQWLVVPNWIAAPCCFAGNALLTALRIEPEEAVMRDRFGRDYETYAARTQRLVPGLW